MGYALACVLTLSSVLSLREVISSFKSELSKGSKEESLFSTIT